MSKYFAGGRIYKLTISALFTFIVAGRLSAITWDMQEKITGDATQAFMGRSVSDAGDINGDGYMDFLIGISGRNRVYIYFGGPQIDSVPDVVLSKNYGSFGISVSTAGDVNGDGYDDVIVGAKNNDKAGSNSGAAYVFYGGYYMDSVYDARMTGESADDLFGGSVSGAGDVNGDGYDDVLVGAQYHDTGSYTDAGAAYLYDFFMFKGLNPGGAEVWNVGAIENITWKGCSGYIHFHGRRGKLGKDSQWCYTS